MAIVVFKPLIPVHAVNNQNVLSSDLTFATWVGIICVGPYQRST